ncbi:MAG: ABC transporter substrate-binding protein [Candidatus Bathyarchaeota archaeon]|nr:ABC transporter substrate-binding protein [Candidatus Bathyarchaeota archaeon]
MKTLLAVVIIAIIAVGGVAGVYLYSSSSPEGGEPQTRTVVDSTGETVEIPMEVNRVVALRSGIVEMLVVLGAEDTIVGVDEQTTDGSGYGAFNVQICPELLGVTAPVAGRSVNVEEVIALDPDVVFIGGYGRLSWIEPLKNANLTVVVAHFEEIGNFSRDLRIVAEVVGKTERAEQVIPHIEGVLSTIDSHVGDISVAEQVSAYFCSHDVYHAYGSTTFEHFQIVTAKGVNVAESITTWLPEISPEQLIDWNPDVIFTLEAVNTDEILHDERIQSVSAISDGKVYSIAEAGWDFGSLRAIFAIEWMSTKLYPDHYSDIDINQEANSFYQAVYGVNYTGPQL